MTESTGNPKQELCPFCDFPYQKREAKSGNHNLDAEFGMYTVCLF